MKFHGMLIDFQ